jgi:hypothetical protein
MAVPQALGTCDFVMCETCRMYFPLHHPDALSWTRQHQCCTLPEYTDFDNRMQSFEERTPVHLMQGNQIPDDYTCKLHDLELLAFGGVVNEPEPEPETESQYQAHVWTWTKPDVPTDSDLTDEAKDLLKGKYAFCNECCEYIAMAAQGSFAFRVQHAECRRFVLTAPDPTVQTPKNWKLSTYEAPEPVSYGDEVPDGYTTKMGPMEELAYG